MKCVNCGQRERVEGRVFCQHCIDTYPKLPGYPPLEAIEIAFKQVIKPLKEEKS